MKAETFQGGEPPVLEAAPPPPSKAGVLPYVPPVEWGGEPSKRDLPLLPLDAEPARFIDAEKKPGNRFVRHLLPLGAILLFLIGTVVHDLLLPRIVDRDDPGDPVLIDPTPVLALRFNDAPEADGFLGRTMTFGLGVLDLKGGNQVKRLMYDDRGRTNNICIRIDNRDYLFGQPDILFPKPGADPLKIEGGVARWVEMRTPLGKTTDGRTRDGAKSVWEIVGARDRKCRVQVTQTVEIVPGEQSGRLDTCLVALHAAQRRQRSARGGIALLARHLYRQQRRGAVHHPGQGGAVFNAAEVRAGRRDARLHPGRWRTKAC